jgi:hypothetical protein
MGETSENKKGIEELLEKIPPEKRWAITAKILTGLLLMRGEKNAILLVGKEEGFFSPVWGLEKFEEIVGKVFGDAGKKMLPQIKESFNIPVEDAIGAAKLVWVAARLMFGPEWEWKYLEKTPERVVVRWTKCHMWDTHKECEVDPVFILCEGGHQTIIKEGFKVINPKLTFKITKAIPRGDPYCEDVYEFKEE